MVAPPPTRFGPRSSAMPKPAQQAPRPGVGPGAVVQGFFSSAAQQPGAAVYAAPPGFRLPPGPGQALPPAFRGAMEQAFRADFSAVRVHVGPEAGALGALAFTSGNTVCIAPGQYEPETPRGQRLLSHELAHVVQQRAGRVRNPLGAGLAVIRDRLLEAEAERLSAQAQMSRAIRHEPPRPVQIGQAAPPGSVTVQAYYVLGRAKLWRQKPDSTPWSGYPYAVVGTLDLPAQEKRNGPDGNESTFLKRGKKNTANIVSREAKSVGLRVSDSYEMAIEDSNLKLRQPKTFFATDTVINASNTALRGVRSTISLIKTGRSIRIIGFWSEYTLHEVSPRFSGADPNALPQNCNEMAKKVSNVRIGMVPSAPADQALRTALGIRTDRAITEADLRSYARLSNTRSMSGTSANTYAAPNVGEAYMIHSMVHATAVREAARRARAAGRDADADRLEQQAGSSTWRDFSDDKDKNLSWPYHFAGVVAQSGNDRITLENYARGDGREAKADPRWYFQMYSTNAGQTFHEANRGPGYANPITVVYRERARRG